MAEPDLGPGETPAVRARVVVLATVGILAALVIVAFGFEPIFRDRIGKTYVDRHDFPAPGVIANERAEREALEARQRALLEGAGGRLPIDAAMHAVVDKGEHAFDPVGAAP